MKINFLKRRPFLSPYTQSREPIPWAQGWGEPVSQ